MAGMVSRLWVAKVLLLGHLEKMDAKPVAIFSNYNMSVSRSRGLRSSFQQQHF